MGTKNNPGKWDCYANAEPDEPYFVLLGRDPMAPALLTLWAAMRTVDGEDPEKVDEARACAQAMGDYLNAHGKGTQGARWLQRVGKLLERLNEEEARDGD